MGVGATLIGSLLNGSFSTNQLVKSSGNSNGIKDDLLHITEQGQGLDERVEYMHLAIERLNSSFEALVANLTISSYERKLVDTAQ